MLLVAGVLIGGVYYIGTLKNKPQTQNPVITSQTIPSPISTADPTANWKTYDYGSFTFKYPSAYYLTGDPAFFITDTKATYDSFAAENSKTPSNNNVLVISGVSLNLDRRMDPNNPNLLSTPEQAIQREINRAVGKSYLVNGSTNVPWENANGGTYDGQKYFYPTIAYEHIKLAGIDAAKVVNDNNIYYFIPYKDKAGDAYVRFIIEPANSTLINVATQILSTFKFTDQNQTNKLIPADSQTPAAGICAGPSNDEIVTVVFGMDNVAQPRCTKVTSNQKLKIVNNSSQTISGTIGSYTINISPNKTQTIDATFGSYLLPGIHSIAGAEIWLQ